ncbi:helix-turn-helix transcriptional regulator [Ramlibacter sp. AN1133]|uniref:helix-turn-helix transcriptional regulator n=1 Tax=Ramlibacter sp. AN1133 TaxID=3133429 RepID=UPI0030C29538
MATTCSDASELRSLAHLTSRPDYFGRVSAVVQRLAGAVDEAEALALLKNAAHCMGADSAAFGSFIRDDPSHESYRFLLACDPVWCLEYGRRAWYAHDPWLNYALLHSQPVRASEIPVTTLEEKEIVELAEEFGVKSAVIVPAPASGSVTRIGVLCLGSAQDGFFEGDGFVALKIAARSLAMELNEWWIDRIKRELRESARITSEDLALLRHERLGHGTKRIAAELGTSPGSVDSRFQRINAKLGVANRKAAASLAAEYGLI